MFRFRATLGSFLASHGLTLATLEEQHRKEQKNQRRRPISTILYTKFTDRTALDNSVDSILSPSAYAIALKQPARNLIVSRAPAVRTGHSTPVSHQVPTSTNRHVDSSAIYTGSAAACTATTAASNSTTGNHCSDSRGPATSPSSSSSSCPSAIAGSVPGSAISKTEDVVIEPS